MLSSLSLSLFLLLFFSPVNASWSFPFFSSPSNSSTSSHRRFQSQREQLLDLSSLGLPKSGLVAAFGDFNGDQLQDLVYLSYDQRHLSIWYWNRKTYQYVERPSTTVTFREEEDFVVTNVVPGDWNYDGKLDLLVMGSKNPGGGGGWWGKKDTETRMKVYLQTRDGTFSESYDLDPSTLPQPIPFDSNGNMKPDLFGFTSSSSSFSNSDNMRRVAGEGKDVPTVWTNTWDRSNRTKLFDISSNLPFDQTSHPSGHFTCVSPTPHQNSFIDLDGDCLADLFLTCLINPEDQEDDDESGEKGGLRYEVWKNDKESGTFVWKRGGDLPKGTKNVGFADMDRDGTIDMVITTCPTSSSCSIYIAYNDQMPLCTETSSSNERCRDPEALCVADDEFRFDLRIDEKGRNPSMTKIPLSTILPHHELLTSSGSFRGHFPTPPQIGDYNIDGYPDLLLITHPTKSSGRSIRTVHLLESKPCDTGSGGCSEEEVKMRRRSLKVVEKGTEDTLGKWRDVESVHWFDVDDDGSLDILVQRSGNSGAARQIHWVKNNYFHDAFFLKAMVLNGACKGWCEPQQSGESKYKPYGSSYSGASFKFTVLDPNGARRSTQYGQLAQTSYFSLSTPYAHLGLGRTNNYVENLFIGSTRHQPQHFINLEGVIPNSQLFVLPYQTPPSRSEEEEGDLVGSGSTDEWKKELYLKPGDWIPWVTIVLFSAIVILGVVVVVLHLNEKREDEIERRARLLSLNFQAL